MDMVIGILDSYGNGALVAGVAAYHLFPDFVGGKNGSMLKAGIEIGRKVLEFAMKTKGYSPFVAGELSLADLSLAPVIFTCRSQLTPRLCLTSMALRTGGSKCRPLKSCQDTQPNLG